MKVNVITCQNALNHGARLQVFALSYYLKSKGVEVEVIDYRPDYMRFKEKLLYWPGRSLKSWIKLFLYFNRRKRNILRNNIFLAFSKRYIPLTKDIYNDINQLRENPPSANTFIAGSDQIWNITFNNGHDPAYYLDFGSLETNRISYAASFSLSPKEYHATTFVKDQLRKFNSISVRETSGISILKSLGYVGVKVVDPVLLLSAQDWMNSLELEELKENKPYILVYDIMGCKRIKKIAQKLSQLFTWPIYSVSPTSLRYVDKSFELASPRQFVQLINNSSFVISNSFHGTVFSLIFNKNFFFINRDDGLNERIHDLLDNLGLTDRIIDDCVQDEVLKHAIVYDPVNTILQKEIAISKRFLENSIL